MRQTRNIGGGRSDAITGVEGEAPPPGGHRRRFQVGREAIAEEGRGNLPARDATHNSREILSWHAVPEVETEAAGASGRFG